MPGTALQARQGAEATGTGIWEPGSSAPANLDVFNVFEFKKGDTIRLRLEAPLPLGTNPAFKVTPEKNTSGWVTATLERGVVAQKLNRGFILPEKTPILVCGAVHQGDGKAKRFAGAPCITNTELVFWVQSDINSLAEAA